MCALGARFNPKHMPFGEHSHDRVRSGAAKGNFQLNCLAQWHMRARQHEYPMLGNVPSETISFQSKVFSFLPRETDEPSQREAYVLSPIHQSFDARPRSCRLRTLNSPTKVLTPHRVERVP
jgi:hypothetical protein